MEEACKLRMLGLSYRQIGERMGCSGKCAFEAVQRGAAEMEKHGRESLQAQRDLELARLDHATTIVMGQVAKLAASNKPNPAAIDQLVRISERRAKLLGLDSAAEVKVQHLMAEQIDSVIAALRGVLDDEAFGRAVSALGGGSAEASDGGDIVH